MLRLRMERAAQLLVKGAPIDQTAEACGYATLSSFYNAFTRYHGCTPAAYRRGRTQPDEASSFFQPSTRSTSPTSPLMQMDCFSISLGQAASP